MNTEPRYIAFAGGRALAEGSVEDVLPVLKRRLDRNATTPALTFNVTTGQQTDFDLTGSAEAVLKRAQDQAQPSPPRGPGRPKLGVTSREISLLPRHWEWLEQQGTGMSGAVRRLVEQAIKENPGRDQARQIRASLNQVLTAVAGNRQNFEEATRALFSDNIVSLTELTAGWPQGIREYTLRTASAARDAERSGASASD